MFCIIIVNIFHNIAVKFLFCPDQRFDPSFKCKRKKRILMSHIFIKFPELLGLGRKEIIVF